MKLLWLASHPVQYQAPMFRALASRCELVVAFAHRQTARQQGRAGYGVEFEWNVDLLEGYRNVFLRPSSARPSIERFWQCRSADIEPLIEAERPDAVVLGGWNLFVYWQALRAAHRRRIPVVVRTDSRLRLQEPAWRRLLRACVYPAMLRPFAGFLAAGTQSSAYLASHRVPASRIFVCPHTVDVGRFGSGGAADADERVALRARLDLPAEARLIVFVGRLLPQKRPLDVVGAVAHLPDAAACRVVYIGDGPLAAAIDEQARRLGVVAHRAGFRNQRELPDWLRACDVLVLPSETETWGIVANEALAAGCPVILSDGVASAGDLGSAPAVLVYPCGDLAALAARLRYLAVADPAAVRDAIGTAVASFAPDRAAALCLAALESLTERMA